MLYVAADCSTHAARLAGSATLISLTLSATMMAKMEKGRLHKVLPPNQMWLNIKIKIRYVFHRFHKNVIIRWLKDIFCKRESWLRTKFVYVCGMFGWTATNSLWKIAITWHNEPSSNFRILSLSGPAWIECSRVDEFKVIYCKKSYFLNITRSDFPILWFILYGIKI